MKFALVVASGVHQGKVINVPGLQLIVGRDEGCHLRPASPAISKKHCAVFIRAGKVFVRDLGSTNGTFLNDEQVVGDREVIDGDRLKVGPLDFTVQVSGKSDSTPLPDSLKSVPSSSAPTVEEDADAAAAMLLGMGDEDPPGSDPKVPEGSTVMEIPAVDATGKPVDQKKKTVTAAESSAAASEILRKYMRRPK
jgi:pSer/pThr/pTyr-binding forkhead associated (FHA) protein